MKLGVRTVDYIDVKTEIVGKFRADIGVIWFSQEMHFKIPRLAVV
jgi:hypothetical protein